jgi:hypothetical protein
MGNLSLIFLGSANIFFGILEEGQNLYNLIAD